MIQVFSNEELSEQEKPSFCFDLLTISMFLPFFRRKITENILLEYNFDGNSFLDRFFVYTSQIHLKNNFQVRWSNHHKTKIEKEMK